MLVEQLILVAVYECPVAICSNRKSVVIEEKKKKGRKEKKTHKKIAVVVGQDLSEKQK